MVALNAGAIKKNEYMNRTPEIKKPKIEDQDRGFQLRCRCKRGEVLCRDDMRFLDVMAETYPEWYDSINQRVFEETKPFAA